jgi:hypothetical protein
MEVIKRQKKFVESEKYLMKDDEIISSEDVEDSKRLEAMMSRKGQSILSKQSSSNLGASKGVGFNKSITDRKNKYNIESLKNLVKLGKLEGSRHEKEKEYFSRKGRLTSSNIPYTSRSPYTTKKEFGLDPDMDENLKHSDIGPSKKEKMMRMDPMQYIKDKSLKEKYRQEQLEQWKKETGHKKSKLSSGKIPGHFMKKLEASGLTNSYSSKEGLNQLYQKQKSKAKGNLPGSFSGAPMNLKNFSSNTQMYNYGTAGYNNLNFSKNKFNMKQRMTNFMTNSKADKFYPTSRNYMRSNEHLMPEISKKSKYN